MAKPDAVDIIIQVIPEILHIMDLHVSVFNSRHS